jgi:hypothetical protein
LIERLPRWEMMSQISSLAALSSLGLRSSGPADFWPGCVGFVVGGYGEG